MRSIINASRILATALCGMLLASCNAVEDVREEPFTPVPTASVVLSGAITGLSTRRAVELQNNGANPKKFYATRGSTSTPLDFAVPVGSAYNITVKKQPFSKICTVANGTGIAGAVANPDIAVTCVNDPLVPRYNVTVTIPTAVSQLSNLRLTLETEDGIQSVDATGLASYTFPSAVFNSLLDVPSFQYKVSASTDTTQGGVTTVNYCLLTSPIAGGRPGMNIATTNENVIIPTGAVTMAVTACSFTVAGTIAYSTPPGGTAQTVGAMTLGLKDLTGGLVAGQTVTTLAGATTFTFPAPLSSHSTAIYDLVVTSHPTGQHCVVSGTTATAPWSTIVNGLGSAITAPTTSGILLLDPVVPDWWAFASRRVTCRALPASAAQLTGVYQMDRPPPIDGAVQARPREFLTFFADGTFLYGINYSGPSLTVPVPFVGNNAYAASGVIHGFYDYRPGTSTIVFSVFTATNTSPLTYSLVGMPGFTAGAPAAPGAAPNPGTVSATNVTRTPGALNKISLTFTGLIPPPMPGLAAMYSPNLPAPTSPATPVGTTPVTKVWTMTEPESIEGEITGTWVTADHRRIFAYNKNETFAFHAGVNGVGNLQDTCLLPDDNSSQSAGLMARRAGSTFNCLPGGQTRTPDLPNWTITGSTVFAPTVIRLPTDLNLGRFPGTATQLDLRPTSPITFTVVDNASTPDTLTVQNTLNGVPIGPSVTFTRYRVTN
jgi:hypothetical protein